MRRRSARAGDGRLEHVLLRRGGGLAPGGRQRGERYARRLVRAARPRARARPRPRARAVAGVVAAPGAAAALGRLAALALGDRGRGRRVGAQLLDLLLQLLGRPVMGVMVMGVLGG